MALTVLRAGMRPDGIILVTSLRTAETPDGTVDMLAMDCRGLYRLRTPLLPISANGAGDTIAALFLLHWLRTRSTAAALSSAASAVYGLLRCTAAAGSRELLTVAAQDEFVTPSQIFQAEPC
jgi:pyridoxine kinase